MHSFAVGELAYDRFYELAVAERALRIQAATATKLAREAEERIREDGFARKSDPSYQARIKNRKLRARYGIYDFVEPQYFGRLMSILRKVDADERLDEEDTVWLSTVGKEYFTVELRSAYHRLEADFFAGEFHKTRDPWSAINASSHYRKCGQADDADALLSLIEIERHSLRIQAALCTTHGGAMRDMSRWFEALRLGERAYALQPRDYRPCTLLGAIYMETGQYSLGQAWYDKAIERGATVDDIDRDIRTILARLPQSRRSDLESFLLQANPTRFAWVQRRRGTSRRRG